jgi:hypothetical protein
MNVTVACQLLAFRSTGHLCEINMTAWMPDLSRRIYQFLDVRGLMFDGLGSVDRWLFSSVSSSTTTSRSPPSTRDNISLFYAREKFAIIFIPAGHYTKHIVEYSLALFP